MKESRLVNSPIIYQLILHNYYLEQECYIIYPIFLQLTQVLQFLPSKRLVGEVSIFDIVLDLIA